MTNYEKHTFLRDNVLQHLLNVWGNLRLPQVRANQLDDQVTLNAIDTAIRAVRRQMGEYTTTI